MADPEGLWKLVEETHKVTSVSQVAAVVKLAARNEYKNIRQGTYESIVTYKERFRAALKAYEDQKNPDIDDKDVAMDFFNGLDNARYAMFKTETMNLLSSEAMKQPKNLNAMYLLANQWVKPKTYAPGLAATFATTSLDQQESSEKSRKNASNKKKGTKSRNQQRKTSVKLFVMDVDYQGITLVNVPTRWVSPRAEQKVTTRTRSQRQDTLLGQIHVTTVLLPLTR